MPPGPDKMSLPQTPQDVWRELERLVGSPLDPELVAYLEERYWAWDVLHAANNGWKDYRRELRRLKEEYETLLRLKGAPPRPSRGRPGPEDRTVVALARLLALEASRRPDVQSFRRTYLGGRTLSLAEAEATLEGWSRQGRPTGEDLWVPSFKGEPAPDWEWVWEYGDGEADFQERRLPVTEGPLEELKALATRLLDRYPWTEASSVALVVSGLTPGVVAVRVRHVGGLHPLRLEAMSWVTGEELRAALQAFRADTPQLFRRHRMLSEKHLALALFAAERQGMKWREVMAEWNDAHPAWRYERLSNFTRDAHQAQRRLRSWAAPAGP
jgi:hypothetical protein